MESKRIAFVLTSLKSGGLERNAAILANHFSSEGHIVKIYCIYSNECFFDLNKSIVLVDLSTNKGKFASLRIWKKELKKLFIKDSISTVVSFGDRCGALCANAVKRLDINHICRGVNTKKDLINKLLLRIGRKQINTFVFQTKAQKNLYGKSLSKKGVLIPNPFYLEKENINVNAAKSKRFITVASFKLKQKRQDFMIEAFAKFVKNHPDYVLELYGRYDDKSKQLIDHQIKMLDLNDKVKIMGETKDVKKSIIPSRAFICSSTSEGMPNALIECLSYGIPVITSNWSGYDEVVDDGVNGFVYGMNDIDGLVTAMTRITDDKLFTSLSQKAIRHKIAYFSYENVLKKWDEII